MTAADTHLQSIGVNFAVVYYAAVVQSPQSLATIYAPSAHAVHDGKKADGAAHIGELLAVLASKHVKEVKLDAVTTTKAALAGHVKVSIAGRFITAHGQQAFTQEVELKESEKNTFGIVRDSLAYPAEASGAVAAKTPEPQPAAATAAPEPVAVAAAAPAVAEEPKAAAAEPELEAKESSSEAAAAVEKEATAPAPAAEPAAAKPSSFLEALRAKKTGSGAAFSNPVKKVTDKPKAEAAAAAAKKPEKKTSVAAAGVKKEGKAVAKPREDAAGPMVYYDIILKELEATVTEEEVRTIVNPVSGVKLVNIVKNERRRRIKDGAETITSESITFAFVQLEKPAEAPETHVKNVVSKLAEHHKDLHVEEVREKKAPAATGAHAKKPAIRVLRVRKPAEDASAPAAAVHRVKHTDAAVASAGERKTAASKAAPSKAAPSKAAPSKAAPATKAAAPKKATAPAKATQM